MHTKIPHVQLFFSWTHSPPTLSLRLLPKVRGMREPGNIVIKVVNLWIVNLVAGALMAVKNNSIINLTLHFTL